MARREKKEKSDKWTKNCGAMIQGGKGEKRKSPNDKEFVKKGKGGRKTWPQRKAQNAVGFVALLRKDDGKKGAAVWNYGKGRMNKPKKSRFARIGKGWEITETIILKDKGERRKKAPETRGKAAVQ